MNETRTWGWDGTVADFLDLDKADLAEQLTIHHRRCCGDNPSGSQLTAWSDCHAVLHDSLGALTAERPGAAVWTLVFEYELPRERGRRPDVVVLADDSLVVMEFKSQPAPDRAFVDQVDAYVRDLTEYQAASHDLPAYPLLVLTSAREGYGDIDGVTVLSPSDIADWLSALPTNPRQGIDPARWLAADYEPLPSLVNAARMIFRHEPLPRIRQAESTGVNEAVDELRVVAENAAVNGGMHLALVAGVPGAGKTLVGLQFVYESHFASSDGQEAIFLSGNGPLVATLQYTLSRDSQEGKVFVRDVHGFLKRYGGESSKVPAEHVWVYDEAQRAWDADRVREKRPGGFSEPEDFLRIGTKHGDWALMVGLIGEGQEIYRGEESGLGQWNEAIRDSLVPWIVHCPTRIAPLFLSAAAVETSDNLNLDKTLRSHKAERVHEWVAAFLDGELDRAKDVSNQLRRESFDMLATRDFEAAALYARKRYAEADDARYGLMVSSQGRIKDYGFVDDFYLKPGPWFSDDARLQSSCCSLRVAVTEFQCQGLELDLPIVGWGTDLQWGEDGWAIRTGTRRALRDPDQITKNTYRVLLTRGRDGFAIVVPPRPELDATWSALLQAGCDDLARTWV